MDIRLDELKAVDSEGTTGGSMLVSMLEDLPQRGTDFNQKQELSPILGNRAQRRARKGNKKISTKLPVGHW